MENTTTQQAAQREEKQAEAAKGQLPNAITPSTFPE